VPRAVENAGERRDPAPDQHRHGRGASSWGTIPKILNYRRVLFLPSPCGDLTGPGGPASHTPRFSTAKVMILRIDVK